MSRARVAAAVIVLFALGVLVGACGSTKVDVPVPTATPELTVPQGGAGASAGGTSTAQTSTTPTTSTTTTGAAGTTGASSPSGAAAQPAAPAARRASVPAAPGPGTEQVDPHDAAAGADRVGRTRQVDRDSAGLGGQRDGRRRDDQHRRRERGERCVPGRPESGARRSGVRGAVRGGGVARRRPPRGHPRRRRRGGPD